MRPGVTVTLAMVVPSTNDALKTCVSACTRGGCDTNAVVATKMATTTATSITIKRRIDPAKRLTTIQRAIPPTVTAATTKDTFTTKARPQAVLLRSSQRPMRCQVCHRPVTTATGTATVAQRENLCTSSSGSFVDEPTRITATSPPIHTTIAARCTASTATETPAMDDELG